MSDPLEKIIRPIVEGQIRGFLKEHPSIVEAVDWYKPRKDKATTFTNSLAKHIVLDLICAVNRGRIEKALFEIWENEESGMAFEPVPETRNVGILPDIACDIDFARSSEVDGVPVGTASDRDAEFHAWFGN